MTGLDPTKSLANERVDTTTLAALQWMAFAYEVATRQRKPTDKLAPEELRRLKIPSIAKNHCVQESSVAVRTLFTRTGPGWTDERRELATPDVALGSMLHVIQDSFSPSHTCRVKKTVRGKPFAVLVDVKNYVAQTAKVRKPSCNINTRTLIRSGRSTTPRAKARSTATRMTQSPSARG